MAFWADLWSFGTAVGTMALAGATYVVIRQGKRQRDDAQRQHQDRFRPICLMVPFDGIDLPEKRHRVVSRVNVPSANPSLREIMLSCSLRNVGVGPALNLSIALKFLDMNGYSTEPWELPPLQAGETRGGPVAVPVRLHDRFNQADYDTIQGKLWEIWLEYEDVFGNRFCSVHHKSPIQSFQLHPAATGADGQQQSAFLAQPWVTFSGCAGVKR